AVRPRRGEQAPARGAGVLRARSHAVPRARRPERSLVDELDDRHRRVVALAVPGLDDPGVAALALGEARSDLLEQVVRRVLVAQLGQRQAAVVQAPLLAVRDQTLGVGTQAARLRQRGRDAAVLEQ